MARQTQWHLSGDYFENCNCSVVCPCLVSKTPPLTSRPTEGVCDVALIFHIEEGRYGDVALDGLNVALAVHTPAAMGEGNWAVAAYIDQRADEKQTEALGSIFTGAAGGPMAAFAPLITRNLGVNSRSRTVPRERSDRPKSRVSSRCRSIRYRPCIRAGKCGQTSDIRSAPTNWPLPWERRGTRSPITACDGTIPARTAITRASAGPMSEAGQ